MVYDQYDRNLNENNKFVELSDGTPAVKVVNFNTLVTESYDSIVVTYPTSSSEVYTFKHSGVSGTTVATLTVTYTDATKENLSTVVKT